MANLSMDGVILHIIIVFWSKITRNIKLKKILVKVNINEKNCKF